MIDLFAGIGGWDDEDTLGIEVDPDACATRAAAGLRTLKADITTLDDHAFDDHDTMTASPPCQDFSVNNVRRLGRNGRRGALVAEPLRFVRASRPRWVALEQVPPVIDIWRAFAGELEEGRLQRLGRRPQRRRLRRPPDAPARDPHGSP